MKNNNSNKLGKGLSSLLGEKKITLYGDNISEDQNTREISLTSIVPNPYQPRRKFNEEELGELATSIKQYGVLQPLVLRKSKENGIYEIIAGERRFRASKLAGLATVPAIIRNLNDKEVFAIAIIENIQRKDLNPIEEAAAYRKLMSDFSFTQQEVSDLLGKSRSYIANIVRLLDLPTEVQEMLFNEEISVGHAKVLVNNDRALDIAKMIIDNNLTVRETEELVRMQKEGVKKLEEEKNKKPVKYENIFKNLEEKLTQALNYKSKITFNKEKHEGKIVIHYNDESDLENIINKLL